MHNILFLIALIATTYATSTQLIASSVNPEIVAYEKNNIPHYVQWRLHTFPACYNDTLNSGVDPIGDTNAKNITVETGSMCAGKYTFALRTLNLKSFVLATHYRDINIETKKDPHLYTGSPVCTIMCAVEMIIDTMMIFQYKLIRILDEAIRATNVMRQYLRDRRVSRETLESPLYRYMWLSTGTSIGHYNDTARVSRGNYTLCDYFRWNNLSDVSYSVVFAMVRIIYDVSSIMDKPQIVAWCNAEIQSQCGQRVYY